MNNRIIQEKINNCEASLQSIKKELEVDKVQLIKFIMSSLELNLSNNISSKQREMIRETREEIIKLIR